uniref:Pentatricopeptide repeat-containing protein n=1 Tax=Oryza meridionalis TaxID=40149 RepID=A0A0E0DEI5_9ORYZ
MEPPHLLRKGKSKLQGQQLILGYLMPAILKAILSLDHKNLLKGTKIVKYLLACMPLPSTFFLDGREQVCFHGSVRSIQMSRVCCLLQSAHTHCHLDLSSFLISARLELKDLSKAINLVQTQRNLVENDRVLLNPAHRAQQEYERVASCCLSGEQEKMVDEWHEQPAAIGVDWVTIDGQIVGAWINLCFAYQATRPAPSSGMARPHHPGLLHLVSHLRASAPLADLLRSAPGLRAARAAHARALRSPFAGETFLLNTLLSAYARLGSLRDARRVFDGMPHRNTFSYNALLSACARLGRADDALALFGGIPDPDQCSYNAVVAALAQHGRGGDALRFLAAMHADDFVLNAYSFASALSACASEKASRTGEQVHALVAKSSHGSDVYIGSALVDMYAKCERPEEARKVFDAMPERNIHMHRMVRKKKRLGSFNERPDSVTMIGVLSACGHSGLVEEGRRYFQTMTEDHGIIPTRDHYTCMVDLLGRAGHLEEVEELIENMPMEPDAVLWASLLGACRMHKNIDMGEWAAGKLFELDPDNSGPYVLLSNMYAELGKWADVFRVRRSMKHRGVSKQPGCSWIEIGRKVNVFLARDNIHPCRNEIHVTLRIIQMQMSRMSVDAEIADDLMNFCSEACG